jgi:hypothetical protein
MSTSELLVIAGVFNENGGAASSFADAFVRQSGTHFTIQSCNGGTLERLQTVIRSAGRFPAVVWLAQVDDSSCISRIKETNKRCLLVQARRNDRKMHTIAEIVSDMIESRTNLCLVIDHDTKQFDFKVVDALGNLWYEGADTTELIRRLKWYISYALDLTRLSTIATDLDKKETVVEDDFFKIVRLYSAMFKAISGKSVEGEPAFDETRFRCLHGYPSMRIDDTILISCRSIENDSISKSDFIAVENRGDRICYSGSCKPGTDALVHLGLYRYYENIRYIIHGHCYVENAPTTMMHVPCGCLEEVEEIKKIFQNRHNTDFAINALGHGCYICAQNLGCFTQCRLVAKPFPEKVSDQCIKYLRNWKHV